MLIEAGVAIERPISSNTCLSVSATPGGDEALIELADEHVEEDRLLDAARVLEKIRNKTLLEERHVAVVNKVETIKKNVADHDYHIWTKQFESHKRYDTRTSFRVHGESKRNRLITTRIETAIDPSLLIPLLAVLGETELYETWMPRFEKPFKPGLASVSKVKEFGSRSPSQIVSLKIQMPWPLWTHELLLDVRACDDIDSTRQIMVKLDGMKMCGSAPPVDCNVERVDFDGGFLFRKCPPNHPILVNSKRPHSSRQNLVLVSMTATGVSTIVVPWAVHRVAWGRMWSKLLHEAEEVRDGKRLKHKEAIQLKKEMYDWVERRVGVMLQSSVGSCCN